MHERLAPPAVWGRCVDQNVVAIVIIQFICKKGFYERRFKSLFITSLYAELGMHKATYFYFPKHELGSTAERIKSKASLHNCSEVSTTVLKFI